jgi:hypothetical protein
MSYYKIITDFTRNRFSNVDLQANAYVIIHELEEVLQRIAFNQYKTR